MAPIGQKFTNHHFFPTPEVPAKLERRPTFVDVGGQCGFRAVAAGFIDNFLIHSRMNGDLLSKVLASHFSHFPLHRTTMPGLVKASDRMEQLIKHVRMSELLPSMAYTLLKIADAEVWMHPQRYPDAFVGRNKWTRPEELHKLTASRTAALAKALGMPIEIQVVERLKTLPLRLRYHPVCAISLPVVIKWQGDHYQSRVTSNCFASLRQQPIRAVQPVMNGTVEEPLLSETLDAVDTEEKRIVAAFADTYNRLALMVTAGELNKEDLLTVYVKNINALVGQGGCPGLEHGSQGFFEAILSAQGCKVNDILSTDRHDVQLTKELVHVLARAISLGPMSEDTLFAQIESAQEARTRHRL